MHLQEEFIHDMAMLRQETLRLELGIQRYLGEDMGCLQYEDLNKLEQELENSVAKVRNRQVCECTLLFNMPIVISNFDTLT